MLWWQGPTKHLLQQCLKTLNSLTNLYVACFSPYGYHQVWKLLCSFGLVSRVVPCICWYICNMRQYGIISFSKFKVSCMMTCLCTYPSVMGIVYVCYYECLLSWFDPFFCIVCVAIWCLLLVAPTIMGYRHQDMCYLCPIPSYSLYVHGIVLSCI
jgi:hypothetical protein